MNLLKINANELNLIGRDKENAMDYSFLVNKGDILEGVVTDQNKVSISLNGKNINVNNSSSTESKAGDTKKYQVMNVSKDRLVLEEVKENSGVNSKIDINSKINSPEFKKDYLSQKIKKSIIESKDAVADNEQEKQLAEKLDKSVIVMSPEDVRAIEEDGKNIEDMDIEEIYNKVSKLHREKNEEAYKNCGIVDKNVDNLNSWTNNNDNTTNNVDNSIVNSDSVRKNNMKFGILIENSSFIDKFQSKIRLKMFDDELTSVVEEVPDKSLEIVDRLFETSSINEDGDKSVEDKVGFVTKDAIKYLIQNELEPTLSNIYKANFAGTKMVTHNISDEDFEELAEQVNDVIVSSGYEINDENKNIAKWLIESEIPLTTETFKKYYDLNSLNLYSKENIKEIVNEYNYEDISIDDMYIGYVDYEEVENVIDTMDNITDEAIENVIKEEKIINLHNLVSSQKNIEEQLANKSDIDEYDDGKSQLVNVFDIKGIKGKSKKNINIDRIISNLDEIEGKRKIDASTIIAKRQLEEIRLKLTLESGYKMALRGFDVSTEELSNVVEELKNIEKEYNDNYAPELRDDFEGQKLFDETRNKVADIKEMSGYVLSATYAIKDKITLQGIYDEGVKDTYVAYEDVDFKISRQAVNKFNDTFETIMTAPRKDMGDSIQKAFRNVDDILDDLGMDKNELNERAVRILGYNNMDITRESILNVKTYDYEVNSVLEKLTPATTVSLIKRGKNPLDMTMKELVTEIDKINDNKETITDDSYSKYLWKLDKESALSEKERNAYIGIYRLLNQIEKSDGAVIGAIVNSGKEITLKNLLAEVRTRKNRGIDVNIDNMFGALKSVKESGQKIDSQINSAFNKAETNFAKNIFADVVEKISPMIMETAAATDVDIMNMPIEKVLNYIEEQSAKEEEIDQEYYEYKLNTIKNIADKTSEAVKLLSQLGLETTMNNVIAASETMVGNGMTGIVRKFMKKSALDNTTPIDDVSKETIVKVKDDLIESVNSLMNNLDEIDKLSYTYNEIEDEVQTIVKAYKENYENSELSIEDLRSISRNVTFVTKMSKKECYEIPLITKDTQDSINITNINLTVIRNTDKKQVAINVESEVLGNIEAKFDYKDNSFKGLVLGDNVQGIEILKNNYNSFKQEVSKEGINIKQLDYGINNKINYTFSGKDNDIDEMDISTKKLYSLSKAFIMNIKETEESMLAKG